MKNHESRPIGSAPIPKVNVAVHKFERGQKLWLWLWLWQVAQQSE